MPRPMPLVEPVINAVFPFSMRAPLRSLRLLLHHETIEYRAIALAHLRRRIVGNEMALESGGGSVRPRDTVAESLQEELRVDAGGHRRIRRAATPTPNPPRRPPP